MKFLLLPLAAVALFAAPVIAELALTLEKISASLAALPM